MSWIRDLDNGRYQAIYRDGAKRQRSKTFDRKKDAKDWLASQRLELAAGRWTDPRAGEQMFSVFVKRWLAGREVEASTAASDKGRVNNHLLPAFGDWPLVSIRYLDITEWMQSLKRKGLSPKTRRECLALLKMILDAAVIEGRLPANPALTVKAPPKIKSAKRKVTRDEIDAVLAKAKVPMKARLATAAYGGLRWGEVCGLRWPSVNLETGVIAVVETMEEIDGHHQRKVYPKDRESRTVPIVAELSSILREHRDLMAAKTPGSLDGLVFPSTRGKPVYRSNNDRALALLCAKAGVPAFNFKDLRAFCASYLINVQQVPVTVVRELLGHSKASMTLDVYTDPPTDWHATVRTAFARPEENADGLLLLDVRDTG